MIASGATGGVAAAATAIPAAVTVDESSSPSEADGAQERLAQLKGEVSTRQEQVRAAQEAVDRHAVLVHETRREYEDAKAREAQALAEETSQRARVTAANLALSRHNADLSRWASASYREGMRDERMKSLEVLLASEDINEFSHRVLVLEQLGEAQATVVADAKEAKTQREDAAEQAADARREAQQSVDDADAATIRVEAAAAEQAQKTAELNQLLAASEAEMSDAERAAKAARAQQWQISTTTRGNGRANAVSGPVGDCAGGDTSGYSNGQIPLSVLCPLWAAPGNQLRADAAYAFNELSMAYAREFGEPICVTDSYRPLAEQVAVKLAKPYLAARPGTSNHGWGVAADLCGGINRFGTPQHEWMRANAGRFAFEHPSWAQQGGSKPEAWHWEFAG